MKLADKGWFEALKSSLGPKGDLVLLIVDVDQIQNYVFESAKLPEMRGASLILDLLNVRGLGDARDVEIEMDEGPVRGIADVIRDANLDPEINVLYSAGGGALLALPPEKADQIGGSIERLYLETTLTVTVTTACRKLTITDLEHGFPLPSTWTKTALRNVAPLSADLINANLSKRPADGGERAGANSRNLEELSGFGRIFSALSYEVRKAKEARTRLPFFELLPFSERCSYCHYRPSFRLAEEADERPICTPCHSKRQVGNKLSGHSHFIQSFTSYLRSPEARSHNTTYEKQALDIAKRIGHGSPWQHLQSPPDIEAIGEASVGKASNYVGIIYADGNEMGSALEALRSVQDFRVFSEAIRKSVANAVFSALAKYISGPRSTVREKALSDGSLAQKLIHYHPFEIVSIGGDDVYLLVPSDVAIDIGVEICSAFETEATRGLNKAHLNFDERPSMSAGVLIASVNSPIYFSRTVVKGLLKSAKRKSKAQSPLKSAIDFQVITTDTAVTEDVGAFRDRAYKNRYNERLTIRPLYLDETSSLLDAARKLKGLGFPQSQLYQLREAIAQGPQPRASNFYNYQRSRSAEMKRKYEPLHDLLAAGESRLDLLPFWKPANEWITPVADLVEIFDFISEKPGSGERQ